MKYACTGEEYVQAACRNLHILKVCWMLWTMSCDLFLSLALEESFEWLSKRFKKFYK